MTMADSPAIERLPLEHPLPQEIQSMDKDDTICKFCGVSYLIHHEVKRLEDQVKKIEEQLEHYKGSVEREKVLKEEVKQLRQKEEEQQKVIQQNEASITLMKRDLQDKDELIQSLTQSQKKLEEKLNDSENDAEILRKQNRTYKQSLPSMQATVRQQRSELHNIVTFVHQMRKSVHDTSSILNNTVQRVCASHSKETITLTERIETLEEENRRGQQQQQTLQQAVQSAQDHSKQLAGVQAQLREKEDLCNKLRADLDRLHGAVDNALTMSKTSASEAAQYKEVLRSKTQEIEDIQLQHRKREQVSEQLNSKFQMELKKKSAELQAALNDCRKLQQQANDKTRIEEEIQRKATMSMTETQQIRDALLKAQEECNAIKEERVQKMAPAPVKKPCRKKLPFHLRIRCQKQSETKTREKQRISGTKNREKQRQSDTKTREKRRKSETKTTEKQRKCQNDSSSDQSVKSKTQNWRDNLSEKNPKKFKEVKHDEATYSRLYRLNMALAEKTLKKRNITEEERQKALKWLEKKKRYNEGCKIRQRKYAAKKKLQKEKEKDRPVTPLTRQKADMKKVKERDRKREQRAAYSKKRRDAVLERRRELYALAKEKERNGILIAEQQRMKKEEQRLKEIEERLKAKEEELEREQEEIALKAQVLDDRNTQLAKQTPSKEVDIRSNSARRKSLHRAKSTMPRKPSHFAGTLKDMVQKASPRTTKAISTVGVTLGKLRRRLTLEEAVTEEIGKGLRGKSPKERKLIGSTLALMKKYKLQREACKKFKVDRKLLRHIKKTQGRKKVDMSVVKDVVLFYEANSTQLPDKKLVSRKTGKPLHVMDRPVGTLYKQYIDSHPEKQVGKSMFYSLRPTHVKTKRQAKYYGCLCEYCENIRLKLKTVAANVRDSDQLQHVQNIYTLSDYTMCKKPDGADFHKQKCIQRKCKECGVKKLDALKRENAEKTVEWKMWDLIETNYQSTKKGSQVKTIKKRALVVKTGTMSTLVEDLKKEATPFSKHIFNKDWQHKQQKELLKNLPDSSVLSILDFSENYKCSYQHEVQTAYYSQNAASLHPIVNYYRCPDCSKVIQESCIMISDDLKHDYHLVNEFQHLVCLHLTNTRNLNVNTLYRFSDGCASQYKSKGPFSDVSYANQDYKFNIHHNFFGTRHGKGPSDGEGAVIKSQASDAVLSGSEVISDAKALFQFTKAKLTREKAEGECCRGFLRTAFFIPSEDVNRARNGRHQKTLKGTRTFHSVTTVGETGGQLATRKLSCFCKPCLEGQGVCVNNQYVDKWKVFDLTGGRKSGVPSKQTGKSEAQTAMTVGEDNSESHEGCNAQGTTQEEMMITSHQNRIEQLRESFKQKLMEAERWPQKMDDTLQKERSRHTQEIQDLEDKMRNAFQMELEIEKQKHQELVDRYKAEHHEATSKLKAELKSIGSHHRAELNQLDRQLQDARNRASAGEDNLKKEVHSLKSIIGGLEDRLGRAGLEDNQAIANLKAELREAEQDLTSAREETKRMEEKLNQSKEEILFLQETVRNECEERFELTEALSETKEQLLSYQRRDSLTGGGSRPVSAKRTPSRESNHSNKGGLASISGGLNGVKQPQSPTGQKLTSSSISFDSSNVQSKGKQQLHGRAKQGSVMDSRQRIAAAIGRK